uniref:Uncharacterized protein n=1 Tax=Anguilla anguilla TaxID=7936 RepID=A0A0E9R7U4_ANGAN
MMSPPASNPANKTPPEMSMHCSSDSSPCCFHSPDHHKIKTAFIFEFCFGLSG